MSMTKLESEVKKTKNAKSKKKTTAKKRKQNRGCAGIKQAVGRNGVEIIQNKRHRQSRGNEQHDTQTTREHKIKKQQKLAKTKHKSQA